MTEEPTIPTGEAKPLTEQGLEGGRRPSACSALRWTRVDGQWHSAPTTWTRYMAVPALGAWYACVMVGIKYKRGETLSPNEGESETEAKDRCESHWQNASQQQPSERK